MEVEITEDKKNALLRRREVKFKATFVGSTPKREDVRSKLSAILNSDKKLTVLDYLKTEYGRHAASGYVKVYDSEEGMKVEPAYKMKRNFEGRKKAEGGEPAAEAPKAVEAPKEKAAEAPKAEQAHKGKTEKKEGA